MIYEKFEKKLNQVMKRNAKYHARNTLELSITNEGEDIYFSNGYWIIHFNSLNGFTTIDDYEKITETLINVHTSYCPRSRENLQNLSTALFSSINLDINNQAQLVMSVREFKKLLEASKAEDSVLLSLYDNNKMIRSIRLKYHNMRDFLDLFNISLDMVIAITFSKKIASVIILDSNRPFDFGFIVIEENKLSV